MKVLFINNEGTGFASPIEVSEGTSVCQLFDQKLPGRKPEDFLIRVNHQVAAADQALKDRAAFFADGRMSAKVVRVLASGRPASDEHYPITLFGEEQAYAGSCTAKSTIYSASIAAGLLQRHASASTVVACG